MGMSIQRRADINQALCEIMALSVKSEGLETILGYVLDVLLNIGWLALEKKGGVFLT